MNCYPYEVKSQDPRVNRLLNTGQPGVVMPIAPLDQFATFEVFVQPREGKPFQHEGAVHAPNLEMAFVLAKETFTRRFTCKSLCVADTRSIFVSPLTEGSQDAYDLIPTAIHTEGKMEEYEVYHLLRRGKQQVYAGRLDATSPEDAMARAKGSFNIKVLNIWVIRAADMRFTTDEEEDLWQTLPEKKYRDASEYKGGEKLKAIQESRRSEGS